MIIGVDIDEIKYPFIDTFCVFLKEQKNLTLTRSECTCYDLHEILGISSQHAIELVNEFYSTSIFANAHPIPGSLPLLTWLNNRGHTLLDITGRPPFVQPETDRWNQLHFGTLSKRTFYTGAYHSNNHAAKSQICREQGVYCILEDGPRYAIDCAQNGFRVILPDCPWNQERYYPQLHHEHIYRTFSVFDTWYHLQQLTTVLNT